LCQVSGVREVSASVTDELGPCRPGRTDTMIKGFKGFDKDLKCKGFQYEIGGEYEEREAKACQKGFHFCENPLDIFSYYQPADSRFAEVEGDGETDRHNDDSKVACTKIKIGAEIKLPGLIEAGVKFILDRVNWDDKKKSNTGDRSAATNTGDQSVATNTGDQSAATNTGYQSAATNTGDRSAATNTGDRSAATNTGDQSAATNTGYQSAATNTGYQSAATNTGDQSAATNTGYQSAATNTGDRSAATNTGDRSAATNTGDRSAATVEGKESVAIATGYKSKARGALGCWIVLAEWDEGGDRIKDVQCAMVDGEKIKSDTFYQLVNGVFVEC